jgi:hypothetical protein
MSRKKGKKSKQKEKQTEEKEYEYDFLFYVWVRDRRRTIAGVAQLRQEIISEVKAKCANEGLTASVGQSNIYAVAPTQPSE